MLNRASPGRHVDGPLPAVPDYWIDNILTKFSETDDLNTALLQTMSLHNERDDAAAFDRGGAIHKAVVAQAEMACASLCEEIARGMLEWEKRMEAARAQALQQSEDATASDQT